MVGQCPSLRRSGGKRDANATHVSNRPMALRWTSKTRKRLKEGQCLGGTHKTTIRFEEKGVLWKNESAKGPLVLRGGIKREEQREGTRKRDCKPKSSEGL